MVYGPFDGLVLWPLPVSGRPGLAPAAFGGGPAPLAPEASLEARPMVFGPPGRPSFALSTFVSAPDALRRWVGGATPGPFHPSGRPRPLLLHPGGRPAGGQTGFG